MNQSINNETIIALLKAANRVGSGRWEVEGTSAMDIFPELLSELEKDGWKLVQPNPPRIPYGQ